MQSQASLSILDNDDSFLTNCVAYIVPQIIQTGSVINTGRTALGVSATNVTPTLAAQNNLAVDHGIVSVTANGPAASAGLQAGDVIVQVDTKPVTDVASLSDALLSKNPGDTVAVTVYRGSQQKTVNVKLGELPAGS